MTDTVTVVLPLPAKCLHPNYGLQGSRGAMFRKASAKKRYRRLASEAVEAMGLSEPWEHAELEAVFYYRTKRRRDDVNALASLKAAYDGLVDGGLLVDDDSEHLRTLGAVFRVDVDHPRVELHLRRKK